MPPARRPPARVRWDRVSRIGLLLVLALLALLYVSPVRAYWDTWHESRARASEVRALQAEHDRLAARARQLRDPAALELEARRLGMVRADERPFVVEGLPAP